MSGLTSDTPGAFVLRGGMVHDLDSSEAKLRDVRIQGGVISELEAQPGDQVIDVSDLIVAPGLIDLHTHVFAGQDLGVHADRTAFRSGATTLIDAGSAGAHLIGAFRASTVDRSLVRIRAFLNISTIGTTSILLGGELQSPWYVSESAAEEAIEGNRDIIVGVKVRASSNVGGDHTSAALAAARRVAERVSLPLMVHLGPAPAGIDEIADTLRPGDVLTHAFTGWEDNGILGKDHKLRPSVRAARERGVILDIGHGMSGFSLEVARHMLADQQPPDTISTDIHAYSLREVDDFPTVLSKFLALGMPLADVLRCATASPARVVQLDGGTLGRGRPADIAVLERVPGRLEFRDAFGGAVIGDEVLRTVMTIMNGRIVFDRSQP